MFTQAECFHRPEDRARPGPLRAPNSQSFRPKSALNAVGCLSVQCLLPPPRTSPPGDRRCPPPAALRPHGKAESKASCLPRAPSSRRPRNKADDSANRRSGGTCPAQDFRCRTPSFPMQTQKPRNAPSPARPSPLMNNKGRRMTPSPFCIAQRFFPACVGLTVSADNPSAPFSPAPR